MNPWTVVLILSCAFYAGLLIYCLLESGHDRDENAPTYGGLPR